MKTIIQLPVFDRIDIYDATAVKCYAFCRGIDKSRGINLKVGNMVSGFPFEIEGAHFDNSECAYICGAFSDGSPEHNAIQCQLINCTNGFMAKKDIRRKHEDIKRKDWESFNVQWMLYVVWQKCLGSRDFAEVLTAIPADAAIIEDSTSKKGDTALVWGARNMELKRLLTAYKKELKTLDISKAEIKRRLDLRRLEEWYNVGFWEGKNIMGKILMVCRQALLLDSEPPIDYELLHASRIHLNGKLLEFPIKQPLRA